MPASSPLLTDSIFPASFPSTAGPEEPSTELVCALKITVSEVMNGKAFVLLFLPERWGLNHVGK